MITLIKYNNRKLYDPVLCRYASSKDVAEYIRAPIPVKIIRHDTGADCTHTSLVTMGAFQVSKGNTDAGQLLLKYAQEIGA